MLQRKAGTHTCLALAVAAILIVGVAAAADLAAETKAVSPVSTPEVAQKKQLPLPTDDVGMYQYPVSSDPSKGIDESALTAEQKKLLKRVRARWAALIEFDLKKVYSFATPAYRKTNDQRHLNGQYAAQITREKAEVQEIKIDPKDPNTAKVNTLLFVTSRSLMAAGPVGLSSWQKETWVKVDGQWWFVEPK